MYSIVFGIFRLFNKEFIMEPSGRCIGNSYYNLVEKDKIPSEGLENDEMPPLEHVEKDEMPHLNYYKDNSIAFVEREKDRGTSFSKIERVACVHFYEEEALRGLIGEILPKSEK